MINSQDASPEPIDADSALKLLMGNRELYSRLLKGFLRDYPQSAQRMRSMLAERKLEEAAILAHSIKGLAANLGGLRLSRSSQALETFFRSQPDRAGDFLLNDFEEALEEFSGRARQIVETLDK